MALKGGLPAVRAEWLWEWQEKGRLRTTSLFGTRVLIVDQSVYLGRVCHREKKAEVVKVTPHYWLGKGIFLVPRWDPLEKHRDPLADKGVESLSREELRARGMYRLEDGAIVLLIYQHVEDALHFQRQQHHIRLETYARELQRISVDLESIEAKAVAGGITDELGNLDADQRRRRQEIYRILTQLAARERAAEILLDILRREISLAKRNLCATLSSKPMKDFLAGVPVRRPKTIEGLRAYLVRIYQSLNQIKVRPLVTPLNLTQRRLREALGSLDVGEVVRLCSQLERAIKSLEAAEQVLKPSATT
ncbi:MAG: hypothetical protein KJ821_08080 [Actinobacteria bacterium]|nr:hypothetical protein [Actinomycetota bacterium]